MRLFSSSKYYIIATGVYVLSAFMRLYSILVGFRVVPTVSFAVQDIMTGLITVILAVYLVSLVRKTSIRIERTVIILTIAGCVVLLAKLLARYGITWFAIPYESWIQTTIDCIAAMLAIVRTSAVVRNRNDGAY